MPSVSPNVYKDGRDFIGWTDTGGIYGEDKVSLEDGTQLTVYPLLNDASDRFFVLTNVPEFFLRYNGLLLPGGSLGRYSQPLE